jgi:hypothetical protein
MTTQNAFARILLILAAAFSMTHATEPLTVETRAVAITRDLTDIPLVITLGYSTGGDGGGAVFKNIGTTGTFADSQASFTDSVGNRFQYVPGREGIHVAQFGAKFDWSPSFSGATDNATAINAAIDFAAIASTHSSLHKGNRVYLPKGTGMFGSQIWVKDSVVLTGQGPLTSILRISDNFNQSTHAVWLGNKDQLASFDTRLEALQIQAANNVDANANIAVVYSNNTQHTGGLRDVFILGGHRVCCLFESGYGGASYITFEHVETHNEGGAGSMTNNPQWILDYGTTILRMRGIVVQGPSGSNTVGMLVKRGCVDIDGFHTEGVARGIEINFSGTLDNQMFSLRNATGGLGVVDVVTIQSTSTTEQRITIDKTVPNGASGYTIADGRSGKPSYYGRIMVPLDF